ncbi:hypothetical protein [Kosakonia radicincitans]|uniref:hypothetical protein n=1 Tax=Kosakonia radicincitans TaxID=283686 RepID=UPI000907FEAB|nr:hypothetical protein [Kosakonia radicincitans]
MALVATLFILLDVEKFEEDRKKSPLKHGFFENKKTCAAKIKRCAEFTLFCERYRRKNPAE